MAEAAAGGSSATPLSLANGALVEQHILARAVAKLDAVLLQQLVIPARPPDASAGRPLRRECTVVGVSASMLDALPALTGCSGQRIPREPASPGAPELATNQTTLTTSNRKAARPPSVVRA